MSSTQEFAGKVVVITGGARNIGRALALEMAAAGAAGCRAGGGGGRAVHYDFQRHSNRLVSVVVKDYVV